MSVEWTGEMNRKLLCHTERLLVSWRCCSLKSHQFLLQTLNSVCNRPEPGLSNSPVVWPLLMHLLHVLSPPLLLHNFGISKLPSSSDFYRGVELISPLPDSFDTSFISIMTAGCLRLRASVIMWLSAIINQLSPWWMLCFHSLMSEG